MVTSERIVTKMVTSEPSSYILPFIPLADKFYSQSDPNFNIH